MIDPVDTDCEDVADDTEYRLVTRDGVTVETLGSRHFLVIQPAALARLAGEAFADVSHLLRPAHLSQLKKILEDPEASDNDRFVATELLKNAVIASARQFPSCQDTGTAIISGKKGQNVLVEGNMQAALEDGIARTWQTRNLRFSQMAPLSMFEEQNTNTNLPAQIDIEATDGDTIDLLFIAKGGGSANKTFLFQETRTILEQERLLAFFDEKIRTLGANACPPYHLALVVGGLSAEQTLKTVKLASTKALDGLPTEGDAKGRAFRDLEMEQQVHQLTRNMGLGAQFGGKYFCHDIRVIRLSRHGGSLPIGMGVSCSADRQIKGKITGQGVWLETLETNPEKYLPNGGPGHQVERRPRLQEVPARIDLDRPLREVQSSPSALPMPNVGLGHKKVPARIDLDRSMVDIRNDLSALPTGTPVLLSGTMIVARDLVHAELSKRLAAGGGLPDYMKNHPIYYAGPAKTPKGQASGSFGPTTAARMDPYIPAFQAAGGSLITIAKGYRTHGVVDSCKKHGGFYLASIGGTAAVLGKDIIKTVNPIDFQDFAMEAVWQITVQNFPAFIIIDNKGNDFYGPGRTA